MGDRTERYTHAAERRIAFAVAKEIQRLPKDIDAGEMIAVATAGVVGAGRSLVGVATALAAALGTSVNRDALELSALCYLRGIIRGADGPIHEDGRPFTGKLDA